MRPGTLGISVEPFIILYAFADRLYFIQSQNLWIEKTCKVGSSLFGNGTTFSDEVKMFFFIDFRNKSYLLLNIYNFLKLFTKF